MRIPTGIMTVGIDPAKQVCQAVAIPCLPLKAYFRVISYWEIVFCGKIISTMLYRRDFQDIHRCSLKSWEDKNHFAFLTANMFVTDNSYYRKKWEKVQLLKNCEILPGQKGKIKTENSCQFRSGRKVR